MSDETKTKKSLILNALAQPGGSELSNAEIAKAVGCFSNLVKSVRTEVEADRLRAENEQLKAENEQLGERIHSMIARLDAAQGRAWPEPSLADPVAKPAPRKPRRVKTEFYPLFKES